MAKHRQVLSEHLLESWWPSLDPVYIGNSHSNAWCCHQMETSSALPALCEGKPPATGGFPSQRPETRSFDVFFDLCFDLVLSVFWTSGWTKNPHLSGEYTIMLKWHHCNSCEEWHSKIYWETVSQFGCNQDCDKYFDSLWRHKAAHI